MDTRIRWGRIILAAVLLEIAITAVVMPVGLMFGNPLSTDPAGVGNTTPYFVCAAAGCAIMGFIFGAWAARKAGARHGLHGLLVGITALALYIALGSLAPGGLAAIITAYGLPLYILFNVLRTLGAWTGGMYAGRQH